MPLKPLVDRKTLERFYRRAWMAHGRPPEYSPTSEQIEIYWQELADLTSAELELGFSEALKRVKFFPKIAEIRQCLDIALERMPRPTNSHEGCPECLGVGWITVERKGRKFAVECRHAKAKSD